MDLWPARPPNRAAAAAVAAAAAISPAVATVATAAAGERARPRYSHCCHLQRLALRQLSGAVHQGGRRAPDTRHLRARFCAHASRGRRPRANSCA